MRKFLLNLVIALNKNSLKINSKYTLIIKVLEHNHPLLEDGQELASIEIDTRVNKVDINYLTPIKDAYLTNEFNDEEMFYNTLYHWIKKFGMYIKNGDVSLRYLIDNSSKKIELPTIVDENGEKSAGQLPNQKDYLAIHLRRSDEGQLISEGDTSVASYWARFSIEVVKKYQHFYGEEIYSDYE